MLPLRKHLESIQGPWPIPYQVGQLGGLLRARRRRQLVEQADEDAEEGAAVELGAARGRITQRHAHHQLQRLLQQRRAPAVVCAHATPAQLLTWSLVARR